MWWFSKETYVSSYMYWSYSWDRVGFDKLIQKYPLITVNGCNNNCPNKILKEKGVEPVDTIIVNDELLKTDYFLMTPVDLMKKEKKCVEIIKENYQKR